MARTTPRERLRKMEGNNGKEGFYGTHNQFAILLKDRLKERTVKIMKSLNTGFLWVNERSVHNTIYNYLLDGLSERAIKQKYKTN